MEEKMWETDNTLATRKQMINKIAANENEHIRDILINAHEICTIDPPKTDLHCDHVAKYGSDCHRCGQLGHYSQYCWKATYTLESAEPKSIQKMAEDPAYETGWKGEQIVSELLTSMYKKILWLNKEQEYFIPIDMFDQTTNHFIEVKTTNVSNPLGFFLSQNEYSLMKELKNRYILYFVHMKNKEIFEIKNVSSQILSLFKNNRTKNDAQYPIFIIKSDKMYPKKHIMNKKTWSFYPHAKITITDEIKH
eukprot:496815_1